MTDFTKPKELTSFEKPGKEKKDPEKSQCGPFFLGAGLCQSYRRIIPERCLQGKSHAIHARTVSTCLVFLKYAFQRNSMKRKSWCKVS